MIPMPAAAPAFEWSLLLHRKSGSEGQGQRDALPSGGQQATPIPLTYCQAREVGIPPHITITLSHHVQLHRRSDSRHLLEVLRVRAKSGLPELLPWSSRASASSLSLPVLLGEALGTARGRSASKQASEREGGRMTLFRSPGLLSCKAGQAN